MMKRCICLIVLAALLCGAMPARADGEPRPILSVTSFTGWSGFFDDEIGMVDEEGGVWLGSFTFDDIPEGVSNVELIRLLIQRGRMTCVRTLPAGDLAVVKSLIAAAGPAEERRASPLCDGGTISRNAYRYGADGACEVICLGMAGDSVIDNFSPAAQALYVRLADILPELCRPDRGPRDTEVEPAAFEPVPVAKCCGLPESLADDVGITAWYADCESGAEPITLSDADRSRILTLVRCGMVTGMENGFSVTGGTTVYLFTAPDGARLGTVELYDGLLVLRDGMYAVEVPD